MNCDQFSASICKSTEFHCGAGFCINKSYQCDGEPDCDNESDEKVQQRYQMTKCHDKRKNKYAQKHKYPLLRIKYSDVNKSKELIEKLRSVRLNSGGKECLVV